MNTILTVLIDLLGEVFPVASPTPVSGHSSASSGNRHDRFVRWGRRILGGMIFALLTALPFLLVGWLGG